MASAVISILDSADEDGDFVVVELVNRAGAAPLKPPPAGLPLAGVKRRREDEGGAVVAPAALPPLPPPPPAAPRSTVEAVRETINKLAGMISGLQSGEFGRDLNSDQREALMTEAKDAFRGVAMTCSVCLCGFEKAEGGSGGGAGGGAGAGGGRLGGKSVARAAAGQTPVPDGDMVSTICGHIYHAGCIAPCIKTSGKCPLCKAALKSLKDFHAVFI